MSDCQVFCSLPLGRSGKAGLRACDDIVHTHMYICVYIYTYIYIHIHIYIYIYYICRQWMKLNMGLDVSQDGLQCSGFTDTWGIPNFNHHLFSSLSNPGFKCFSEQLQDHQYLRY